MDREPQPSDGPEYHADHAAWEQRQRPSKGRWVMPEAFDGAIHQRDAARRMVRRLARELRKLDPAHPLLDKIKKVL